jgi:hypothetical protein
MSNLTADFLRHLLHYDPLTGVWTWMNPLPRSRVKPGDVAGRITSHGRRQIRIASGFYYSGRLAWLYMTGEWPKDQIDHVNRIKDDDRWENLREATQSQNSFNRAWAEVNGDLRGISLRGNQLAVSIGGQYLGLFKTIEEAIAARDRALKEKAGPFVVIPSEREAS